MSKPNNAIIKQYAKTLRLWLAFLGKPCMAHTSALSSLTLVNRRVVCAIERSGWSGMIF